jgi:CheY-like chemotaxis protein
MAKRMLEKLGHVIESASNGSLGLNRLCEVLGTDADFDLVLCDFQMPVMDGFEAMRRYREFERAAKAAAVRQRVWQKSSAGVFAEAILSHGSLLDTAAVRDRDIAIGDPHDDRYHTNAAASQPLRQDMAIVGMSANSDLGSQSLAREAGMNAFVPKPFSMANLLDVLILFR